MAVGSMVLFARAKAWLRFSSDHWIGGQSCCKTRSATPLESLFFINWNRAFPERARL